MTYIVSSDSDDILGEIMIYDRLKFAPYAIMLTVLHMILPNAAFNVVLGGVLVWGVGYILYSWYTGIAEIFK